MLTPSEQQWFIAAYQGARDANHIFPEMAACEAALESTWGQSKLATLANNLFGEKQHSDPIYGTLALPTREFINNEWITVTAAWVKYPTVAACFADRMATLMWLAPTFPHYAAALAATDPKTYVTEVSKSWATDHERANKCIAIYSEHAFLLEAVSA